MVGLAGALRNMDLQLSGCGQPGIYLGGGGLGLAVGLSVCLDVGLAVGLADGLAFGLAVGLAVGLAAGLAVCLAVGCRVTGNLVVKIRTMKEKNKL